MAGGAAGQQGVGSQGVRQTPPVQPSMNNLPPAMGGMGGVGQNQLGAANNAAINRIAPITGAGTSNPYGIGPTGVQTPAVQQPRINIPTPVGVQPPATQTQSLPSTLGNIGGTLGGGFGLSSILPASDITALAEFARGQGGMPIQAPNGNFGVFGGAMNPSVMSVEDYMAEGRQSGLPSEVLNSPEYLNYINSVRNNHMQALRDRMPQGDTFIPTNVNRPPVPFTQTLQGLGMGGGLPMQGGIGLGGAGQVQQPEFYTNYLRELANSGQRSTLPITPGPMRSTPTPARPLPPRPGPQVQPIRRPLSQPAMGGLAGLAGLLQGRR